MGSPGLLVTWSPLIFSPLLTPVLTMANLRQTPLTCSGHTRPVVFLAFSDINPEGQYYSISACKDGKPMLRAGDTGDWIGTFEGHKGAVWGVDLNQRATRAASGAADFSAKVWNAVDGEELLNLQHKHIVKSVNFSRDSVSLATASNDKVLRIFDLEKTEDPKLTFDGHTSGIKQVLFNTDERRLISCADDKTLRFWDITSGLEVKKIDLSGPVGGMELNKEHHILNVTHGQNVSFFNPETFEKIKDVSVPTNVTTASLLHSKRVFVCGGEDFKLYKYNYDTGVEIESFKGHFGPVHCVRFSPDGELYASGSEDGTLRLWQTEVGKTYGLWKCVDSVSGDAVVSSKLETVS